MITIDEDRFGTQFPCETVPDGVRIVRPLWRLASSP